VATRRRTIGGGQYEVGRPAFRPCPPDLRPDVEGDAYFVAPLPDHPAGRHAAAGGNEHADRIFGGEHHARRQTQTAAGRAEILDDAADRRRQSVTVEGGHAIAVVTRLTTPFEAVDGGMSHAAEKLEQFRIGSGRPGHGKATYCWFRRGIAHSAVAFNEKDKLMKIGLNGG